MSFQSVGSNSNEIQNDKKKINAAVNFTFIPVNHAS